MSEITKEVLEGLQGTFATKAEVETQLNAYKGDLANLPQRMTSKNWKTFW